MITRSRGWRGGIGLHKMGEGDPKIQTSSYKINKSWDIIYSVVTTVNNTGLHVWRSSLVAQTVKCLPAMWETWVWIFCYWLSHLTEPYEGRGFIVFTDAVLGPCFLSQGLNKWLKGWRTEQNNTNISNVYKDLGRGGLGSVITKMIFHENYWEHL